MGGLRERHSRNFPALSEAEMMQIYNSRVLVVGCGGLGGNIIENLSRMGIGYLRIVDGDTFAESNLNRQLLSNSRNLGCSKVLAAQERIHLIDPEIEVDAHECYLTKENAATLMADVDLVVDALDNVDARLILEDAAAEAGLAIVHGAISGWDLQVMLVPPGSGYLHELYYEAPVKRVSPSLPMTPAACAAMEAACAVQYLAGREVTAEKCLIVGSLLDMSFDTIRFGD